MAITRQDFVGFSFNGRHSSEFNIVRVSDGSRFKKDLLPTFQDKTVAVPGGDGSYLFGTNYTQKPRTISFAYDNLTEEKMFEMRRWLAAGNIGELILDEWPYKAWDAKVSAPPSLAFIPFDEENPDDEDDEAYLLHNHDLDGVSDTIFTSAKRVFKGEGTISFVSYQPFAHNPKGKKWLEDYSRETNYKAWRGASGLRKKGEYDVFDPNKKQFTVFNAGDLPCDFYMSFEVAAGVEYTLALNENIELAFTATEAKTIRINTKLHLIEELKDGAITGIVHNNWITQGDFFKLPLGASIVSVTGVTVATIDYQYRYLN